VIVGALVFGCLSFMAIALVMRPDPQPAGGAAGGGNQQPLVTWIALGVACVALPLRVIVPGKVVSIGRRAILRDFAATLAKSSPKPLEDPDHGGKLADRLAALLMTRTIMACAILEGASFFLLAAYLLEGRLLALGVAITLILVLGGCFPTRSVVLHWIEVQARLIDEEWQLEGR
jgi:hypothetical protein